MSKIEIAVRGVRKSAHIGRKVFSKGANFSGRIEKKADQIIHGTDPTIRIHNSTPLEKLVNTSLAEITPIHPALPLTNRKPNVTLFIPSLKKRSFFGGTATALILAGTLAKKKNLKLRIVQTLEHGSIEKKELTDFYSSNGLEIETDELILVDISPRRYNHYGYLDTHPKDTFIASAWWDAHLLNKLPLPSKYLYLIQDFEPIFYNNSDKYVLAEQTYRNNSFIPICNTELMYKFMSERGYEYIEKNGLWFEPAVSVPHKNKSSKSSKKRLFIYGRPSVARNLFFFALESLDELFSTDRLLASEWDLCMAGQDSLSDIILPSGVKIQNLGKMNIDEYYKIVEDTDLAISPMMAPHPNYPTLEFASAGAAVVTTEWETKKDLSGYSKNIIISRIDKERFKEAIMIASKMDPGERYANARSSNIPSSWQKTLEEVVKKVS